MAPPRTQLKVVPQSLPTLTAAVGEPRSGRGGSRPPRRRGCDELLAARSAEERVEWALENLPDNHVLTSSFGAQAAVSLHLITRLKPAIPVVFIDTGYLFPETYQFVDQLAERLELDLRVYRSAVSPAWQEARFGRRWDHGIEGLNAYNLDNKVEPMQRALRELHVGTWLAGLRRSESSTRAGVDILSWPGGERCKLHPIADWSTATCIGT